MRIDRPWLRRKPGDQALDLPAKSHCPATCRTRTVQDYRPFLPPETKSAPVELPKPQRLRPNFCCDRDGCRKRTTPPSVRFLGRKVYLGAIVILISAMRQGPSPRRVRELSARFGVGRQTIARWQVFWREHFQQSPFWKIEGARFEVWGAKTIRGTWPNTDS